MSLSFNTNGHLHKNVALTFQEFVLHFGINPSRRKKIENTIIFCKLFFAADCQTVYVGGSFVSTKKNPEDIDLCFDLRNVREKQLKTIFPEFFDSNKLGAIRRKYDCHIWHFDDTTTHLFEMLKYDRDDNPKGLVKLRLKEIVNYDQK